MEHTAHKASRGGNSYVTLTNELHAWETGGNVGNISAYSVEYTTQEASRGGNSYHITLNNELHAWETGGNVGNISAYSVEYTTQEASRGGNYHITLNNELHAWETDICTHSRILRIGYPVHQGRDALCLA